MTLAVLLLFAAGCRATGTEMQPQERNTQVAPTQLVQGSLSATPTPLASITPGTISCQQTVGEVQQTNVSGLEGTDPVNVKVYMPPCYDSAAEVRYPVLYLLHGQGAQNDQWLNLGITRAADELISSGQIRPLLIVLPQERDTYLDPETSSFGSAIIESIIPYIDSHFSTCTTRSCRAIGGLSRGGNWAVELGFSNPDLFTVVGAHSSPLFYGEPSRIQKAITTMESPDAAPFVVVDVGDKDKYREDVKDFVATLEHLHVPYRFTEFSGKHEEPYWSAHVLDYLAWYSSRLNLVEGTSLHTPVP